jgi:hypothetical protein
MQQANNFLFKRALIPLHAPLPKIQEQSHAAASRAKAQTLSLLFKHYSSAALQGTYN